MNAASESDTLWPVVITTDGVLAKVVVDGADLSHVLSGYQVEHRAGQAPLLVLFATPTAGMALDGLAQVAVATEEPPGEAIAAFLRGIDPGALSRAALNRDDLDGGPNELTAAMLATLADWAQGRGI